MLSSWMPWGAGSRWWFLLRVPAEQGRGTALPAGGSDGYTTSVCSVTRCSDCDSPPRACCSLILLLAPSVGIWLFNLKHCIYCRMRTSAISMTGLPGGGKEVQFAAFVSLLLAVYGTVVQGHGAVLGCPWGELCTELVMVDCWGPWGWPSS